MEASSYGDLSDTEGRAAKKDAERVNEIRRWDESLTSASSFYFVSLFAYPQKKIPIKAAFVPQ